MITITTTEAIIDGVPENLPVTCLRRLKPGQWRLKTATEHGVKQIDFDCTNDLDSIEKALTAWRGWHPMAVGPIVICFDRENYFGLEARLSKVFPEGRTQQGVENVVFPWSTKPKM